MATGQFVCGRCCTVWGMGMSSLKREFFAMRESAFHFVLEQCFWGWKNYQPSNWLEACFVTAITVIFYYFNRRKVMTYPYVLY